MNSLEKALCHALALRAELDDTDTELFDSGYGGWVDGWPHVPRSAIMPRNMAKDAHWLPRLSASLDLLGIGLHVRNGKMVPFYRQYPTGPADVARDVRSAFLTGLFGPEEYVQVETLEQLGEYLKLTPKRARLEEILAVSLEDVGFASLGERRSVRGVERVQFSADPVVLKLWLKKLLPLAPSRKFQGPKPVPADELLRRHVPGFTSYLNHAQRAAVHELCDPDGSPVVIAQLPTGGGKSLCYFLAAAHALQQGRPHTAVVVSPIVALQNDQVLRVANKLNAELDATLNVGQINMTVSLEERKEIYGKLFRGELHVLFLSPEKLLEPFFRETLLSLAEQQRIGFLVIDEAHIVPEWGRDFRTEFHRLGVIREELHDRCPSLRTLILSATLTPSSERRVLEILRIEEDECSRITDNHIRQEISIRVERFDTREERLDRLLEIAPFLPSPTIVYCNRKDNVRLIRKRMKDKGIFRSLDYTGSTPADSRPKRLQAFHRGDVSFVVGTNAFGLGIDKQDVRSVVHFDVPANLDACYQEIGRAARDRRTGHAFILYSPRGMGEATRRGRALIKSDKAWDRAQAMLRGRCPKKRGCAVLLPIHAVPAYMREEGKSDSELNREWNLATLNILERQDVVDVRGVVYRHLRVSRSEGKTARKAEHLAPTLSLVKKLMGRRKSVELDLVKVARDHRLDMGRLHSQIIALRQLRAIEVDPLDEDIGEMWVLANLRDHGTWSPEHMALLEEIREEDLAESNAGTEALRRFFKRPGCRLRHFADLYEFPTPKPCGHCDRCKPILRQR